MRAAVVFVGAALLLAACAGRKVGGESVTLLSVTDSDSMRLMISGEEAEVRLLGVNTPEAADCHGSEAASALETLARSAPLRVSSGGGDGVDRFGRLLRYVYAGNRLVNLALIEDGHGLALTTDHDMKAAFRAATDRAWANRLGMWAETACGPQQSQPAQIRSFEADPPGDDGLRPNEEYIDIGNEGPDDIDLAGWVLRDESSSNRYAFANGTILAPDTTLTVHSGCGTDTPRDRFWCTGPVWSNGGDSVILQDHHGNVVDARFYGSG